MQVNTRFFCDHALIILFKAVVRATKGKMSFRKFLNVAMLQLTSYSVQYINTRRANHSRKQKLSSFRLSGSHTHIRFVHGSVSLTNYLCTNISHLGSFKIEKKILFPQILRENKVNPMKFLYNSCGISTFRRGDTVRFSWVQHFC